MGNQSGIGEHVVGKRARQIREAAGAAVDFVTGSETGNAFADRFHGAGKVHTEQSRQIRRERQILSHATDHGVDRVHAGRSDTHDDMPGFGRGLG